MAVSALAGAGLDFLLLFHQGKSKAIQFENKFKFFRYISLNAFF